jgi:hypothetical protein
MRKSNTDALLNRHRFLGERDGFLGFSELQPKNVANHDHDVISFQR